MLRQLVMNGVVAGSTYGLVAIGFSLTYRTAHFFHFAHGAFVTCAAYLVWLMTVRLGLNALLGIIGAILLTALLGVLIDSAVYRPLRRRNATSLVLLLASLGVYVVIQNLISLIFGDDVHTLMTGGPREGASVFGARITVWQTRIVIANATVYVAIWFFLNQSRTGKKIRAMANDPNLANVVGINLSRLTAFIFGLGSVLAAVAGILIAYDTSLTPSMGFNVLLFGIVAVIVGGATSNMGAMLGGMLVGMVQQIAVWKFPTQWQDSVVFVILILFLLLRPQGFFGRPLTEATV